MKNEGLKRAAGYVRTRRFQKRRRTVTACLAAAVVFCTIYALVLPAVALEKEVCQIPEHTHSEACYTQMTSDETTVHTHNENCYTPERGGLICTEEEREGHTHSAENGCFDGNGELTCQIEENGGHQHTDDCYDWEQVLSCGLSTDPAGEPGDAQTLTCQLEENEEHQHGALCYGTWELTCGLMEHTHTEECNIPEEPGDEEQPRPDEEQSQTEEEQAQVEKVIALIDALPAQAEIEETLAAFEDAGDGDGYDAYLTEIAARAKAAYEVYSALTEAQQSKVANADKLMALEPLWSVQPLPEENSGNTDPVRLLEYAGTVKGTVEITVSDANSNLEPDPETGEYNVTAGETYTVRVAYKGNELDQGKYYVTFASNIDLTQKGTLTCTDNQHNTIDAGAWYFEQKDDGTVWLIFNITGDLSKHSGITLVADVTCQFGYTDQPMEFDGQIKVNIHHNENSPKTNVYKSAEGRVSNGKIRWESEIYGNSGSKIIGNTVTDTITTPGTHYFSNEDMEAGITFEAARYAAESAFLPDNLLESHSWTVKADSEGMNWTDTQWTYTMPAKIICTQCGQTVTLGNDDWRYSMQYTSTVRADLPDGYNYYENKIVCDGDTDDDGTYSGGTHLDAEVIKTGKYTQVPDTGGDPGKNDFYANDTIDWTITADIPAARQGEKFDYFWYIVDTLQVEEGDQATAVTNTLSNITVTAEIGGQIKMVPEYNTPEAESAEICWRRHPQDGADLQIDFYTKCKCTEENCPTWKDNHCVDKKNQGFCRCWSSSEDVKFTITYSTPISTQQNGSLADRYGGRGADLVNQVVLWNKEKDALGKFQKVWRDKDRDKVAIPGVFTKKLTARPEDNGLIAQYTITVNEAKADLRSLQELTITDTMTYTLNLIPSSLKIQYEDSKGNERELPAEKYTVSSVEEQEIAGAAKKVFTIKLHSEALGPYKYTLTYNASVRGDNTTGLDYQNNASVALFGKDYTVTGEIIRVPQAAIGARTYQATLLKMDADKSKRLGLNGAVFELYSYVENGDDVHLHDYTTGDHTDSNNITSSGIAQIETLPAKGVILHSHTLYYVQEKTAPNGYQLDDTRHYFWFCNDEDDDKKCELEDTYGAAPYHATCIYSGTDADTADLTIFNEAIPTGHELPSTGGTGTAIFYILGSVLLIGAAVLLIVKKRMNSEK